MGTYLDHGIVGDRTGSVGAGRNVARPYAVLVLGHWVGRVVPVVCGRRGKSKFMEAIWEGSWPFPRRIAAKISRSLRASRSPCGGRDTCNEASRRPTTAPEASARASYDALGGPLSGCLLATLNRRCSRFARRSACSAFFSLRSIEGILAPLGRKRVLSLRSSHSLNSPINLAPTTPGAHSLYHTPFSPSTTNPLSSYPLENASYPPSLCLICSFNWLNCANLCFIAPWNGSNHGSSFTIAVPSVGMVED